jgi:hypothetical protein
VLEDDDDGGLLLRPIMRRRGMTLYGAPASLQPVRMLDRRLIRYHARVDA